jgi:hypothetical protein
MPVESRVVIFDHLSSTNTSSLSPLRLMQKVSFMASEPGSLSAGFQRVPRHNRIL